MSDFKKRKVRWDKENYVPKKVNGFKTSPFKGTQREIAEAFLKENLDTLKIQEVE